MTHDELLARVQYNQGYQMGLDGYKICSALREVVELHKPVDTIPEYVSEEIRKQSNLWCAGCYVLSVYPCDTIQAIESALQ